MSQALVDQALADLGVQLTRELQEGGQKRVFLVDRGSETFVLKVISLTSSRPDAMRRAQREVDLLARLDSPFLVKVESELLEMGSPPQGVAWLEQYIPGEDVRNLVGAPWPWPEVLQMGRDVAHGLGVMHRVGVVHRDLSGGNVRRATDGRCVVLDPGFARHTLRSGITIGGQPGTRGHLSPEHLNTYSAGPTAASDVFCVAILMLQALTGSAPIPWLGDDADYLGRLSRVQVATDFDSLPSNVGDEAKKVLRRMLHRQPARRYLNGERLAVALEHLS